MPINLLGGDNEKKDIAPEKKEQVSREYEMTKPSEKPVSEEEKGGGISAFFTPKKKKVVDKKEEPALEPAVSHKDREDAKEKKHKREEEPAEESGGFDISLMPSRSMVIPRTVRSSFFIFLAALVTVGTIFGLVWAYTDLHFEKIKLRIHTIQGEMQLLEAKSAFFLETRNEIEALERKSQQVGNILDKHIYWTKFFTLLEANTIPDVYFGDFSANTQGSIHLDVIATDLTTLAKQLVSFRIAKDFVKESSVSGIRKIPDGIAGVFDLTLTDAVFYK